MPTFSTLPEAHQCACRARFTSPGTKCGQQQNLLPGGRKTGGNNHQICSSSSASSGVVQLARIARHAVAAGVAHQVGNLLAAHAQLRQPPRNADLAAQFFHAIDKRIGRGRIGRLIDSDRPSQLDQPPFGHHAIGPQGHRQHHGTGQSMRHLAVHAQCRRHAVGQSQTGIGQAHARHQRRVGHHLARSAMRRLAHRHRQGQHGRPQNPPRQRLRQRSGTARNISFRSIA